MTSSDEALHYQDYCDDIQENYPRRHAHLYELREDFFVPSFSRAVRAGSPAALRSICTEVHPGVYSLDMLRPSVCREILEEVACFEEWMEQAELPVIRPNTMNNHGAVLDTFGLGPMLQQLMQQDVLPFSSLFYPEVGGASLDEHHGFVVAYEIGKDTELGFHVDASDVTLNVCLGQQFQGGELFFRGVRCGLCQHTEPLPHESFEVTHVPGRAFLHRGNHRHGANPITAGQRYNLILWCFSSSFGHRQQREHRREWCGWPEPGTGESEQEA